MNVSKRADCVTGILLVVVAAYVYTEAAAMPVLKRGLGPGGYPQFIAIGLGVLGMVLAAQSLLKGGDAKPLFSLSASALGRVAFFLVLSFAYVEGIPYIGFVLATIVFLLAATPFFGYRRPVVGAVFAVLLAAALYLTFRYCFLVLIPTGSFFA